MRATSTGNVVAQCASKNPNRHFNLIVDDAVYERNLTLTVSFRAVSGEHDQGGGCVWRYQDERNHCIVRANPLENNVALYKMENGIRTDLPVVGAGRTYGLKVDGFDNTWHTLQLRAQDEELTVCLDGRELFRIRDRPLTNPVVWASGRRRMRSPGLTTFAWNPMRGNDR